MDSRDLVSQSRDGNRQAIGVLVQRHLPALKAFVRLRLGAIPRARESDSDVVQSVCLELLRDLSGFEYQGEGQFRNWLYTAALNKIRQRQRFHGAECRDARREQPPQCDSAQSRDLWSCYASIVSPSHDAIAREEAACLEDAFARLPEHYREVITLARIVGLSQEDLAKAMERTVPSVRNLLNRALVRLATLMDSGQDQA